MCYDGVAAKNWALNSAVECHLHTVEVIGSNPIAPTTSHPERSLFAVLPDPVQGEGPFPALP